MFKRPQGPVEIDENGNPIPSNKKRPQNQMPVNIDLGKLLKHFSIPIVLLLVVLFVFATATYTVNEMEQAVIIRFGSVQTLVVKENAEAIRTELKAYPEFKNIKVIEGKGLFFKLPFIDDVEKYTSQLLTYNTLPREVTTSDKKKIVLDNSAQWHITNPVLFRQTLKSITSANTRLDDIIYSKLNERLGLTQASTLISDKAFVYEMTANVKDATNEEVSVYGMEVFDVRIAKTELPQQNYENIFNRMRTERQKQANRFRAEGDESYLIITSESDKEVVVILAEAYAKAEEIRGQGDAEALEIYAQAYNKDPEFYQFYKTLLTYKEALGTNSRIIIDSDSEFAKYLFDMKLPQD